MTPLTESTTPTAVTAPVAERSSCTICQRPVNGSRVLSTHHTSQGWVRYRRCACGHVSIELVSLDEPTVVLV